MPETLTCQAPAKLNLALSVGPPAEDGMHPICTWMVAIDLCDELTVTRLEADRLSRYAIVWHDDAKRRRDIDWPITRDLAVRAHLALEQHTNSRLPVQLKLQKRIPVAGGLGGGSSDAAAMLRTVNELYELGLSMDQLREVAAGIGSDVPFFIAGGSAVVQGFGDEIEHHDRAPQLHAVIVFPEAMCPTGHVYSALDELSPGPLRADEVKALIRSSSMSSLGPEAVFNDLTQPAIRVAPELQGLLAKLTELAERPAHVAGSGSSLFVLCDDALHAQYLAEAIEQRLDLPALAVQTHETCDALAE